VLKIGLFDQATGVNFMAASDLALSRHPARSSDTGARLAIQPVILAGGSGTRLWPMSREHFPKQLIGLVGDQSLLQATAHRLDALPMQSSSAMRNIASRPLNNCARMAAVRASCWSRCRETPLPR
jgi:hypothetical protein